MMSSILGMLGTPKGLAIILAGAVGLGMAWWIDRTIHGDAMLEQGRKIERADWVLKIATEPVKSDTTRDTSYTARPPQHLEGEATYSAASPMRRTKKPVPAPECLELAAERDSLQGAADQMSIPAHATFFDSLGGVHRHEYDPVSRKFTEDYIPPPAPEILERIHDRQEIPIITERRWWGMLMPGYSNGPAIAGMIGYQNLGLGYGRLKDSDLYLVGIRFEF